jgi:hypothetical protein
MEKTMTEVCNYLNNFFWEKKIQSTFTIENGTIDVPALKDGQYFRIIGSTFNDGVHKYPITQSKRLKDETFKGEIWAMAVPEAVTALTSEIEAWNELYGRPDSINMGPYTSESFSGYSYSKGAGSATGASAPSWQDVYAGKLAPYRRLRGAR